MNNLILKDLFGVERVYNYSLDSISKKTGKFTTESKVVIFHTQSEDELRYIEDVAEEVCRKHHLPFKNTIFFEVDSKDKWWRIDMIWEPSRFRNTCFIELQSAPIAIAEEVVV